MIIRCIIISSTIPSTSYYYYYYYDYDYEVGRKLSPAEAGMSSEEVFQRLDGLDSKDGALSQAEFDKESYDMSQHNMI